MADCLISPDELHAELKAIQGEAMGWLPLGERAYVHQGNPEEMDGVICVVGVADADLAGNNILLLA